MGYLVAFLIYNFTEAAFKSVSRVWLVWHIIALDYPRELTVAHQAGVKAGHEFGPATGVKPARVA